MTLPPTAEALDTIYLKATLEKLGSVLSNANFELKYFLKEIEYLTMQLELSSDYRQAYGQIVMLLESLEQANVAAEKETLGMNLEILENCDVFEPGLMKLSHTEDAVNDELKVRLDDEF